MSLQVDDTGRRARSRSPGYQDEHRDRSRGRAPRPGPLPMEAVRMPSPPAGFSYDDPGSRSVFDFDDPRSPYQEKFNPTEDYTKYSTYVPNPDHARGRDADPNRDKLSSALSSAAALLPKYSQKLDEVLSRDADPERARRKQEKKERLERDLAYGNGPSLPVLVSRPPSPPPNFTYAKPPQREYDGRESNTPYTGRDAQYNPGPLSAREDDRSSRRSTSPYYPDYLSATGSSASRKHHHRHSWGGEHSRSSSPHVLVVEPTSGRHRGHSPQPPHKRMASLSVSTTFPPGAHMSVSHAPPSPMLESYHGTYQSMSPMPSPLLLPSNGGGASPIEPMSPGLSDDERGEKKKRRARFTDPVDDAARLAKALKGDRRPDTEPLIEILPSLTHEQILELRSEYKRLVKTGSERKGVNIAKHIRARLKDEDPLLMKACYTCALGQWESEAYWSNTWYHGDKTRRELLIESVMGRTNAEIRSIKDGFSDKKYRNSLTQCMKTELKEDKFKKAVLLVLEEKRMEETDEYGHPLPIDKRLVEEDVVDLRKAIKSEKGGESAMIQIVVVRSDLHLKEVLKRYESTYGTNFARDALKKSGNLVVSTSPPFPSPSQKATTDKLTAAPGRAAGPHSERHHQQARAGRAAPEPRAHGVQEGRAPARAAHQPAGALPLGPPPHGGRQGGLQAALRRGPV